MARRRNGRNDRALIAEVKRKLLGKRRPDMMDWVLALMRRGFSKDEAKALFFKEGYLIDSKGYIVTPAPKSVESRRNIQPRRELAAQSNRQISIDKTLAEMDARSKRMEAMAEAARRGRTTIKPPLPPAKTTTEPQIARKIEDILCQPPVVIESPKPSRRAVEKNSGDLDKKLRDLESGWDRLRRIAKEARGK